MCTRLWKQYDTRYGPIYKLTRRQYYKEAGIRDANRKKDVWNAGIADSLRNMSKNSSKGVGLAQHQRYEDAQIRNREAIWKEYLKPRWAQQRLRLYGGKKRVFANFFNAMERKLQGPVYVAFGAAKFAPGGKGEVAAPTSRAFKECCHRFPTVAIDEFRTSKISNEDDSVLQQVQRRSSNGNRRTTAIRGLLWSTTTCKFVGRDKNAALNILRCAVSNKRPVALDRKSASGRIEQHIAKRIR
jgi:hypothetical protein